MTHEPLSTIQESAVPSFKPGRERRAWVRHLVHRPGRIASNTSPTIFFLNALILDVSRRGLGLEVRRPVEIGTTLVVEVQGCDLNRKLIARVLHSTKQESGWRLGCELASGLTDAELNQLVG